MIAVKTEQPANRLPQRARCHHRVTIWFKDSVAPQLTQTLTHLKGAVTEEMR
jgi:hypothetical protein